MNKPLSMQLVNKYQLSYTAASLRLNDTIEVINAYFDNDIERADSIIGNGKIATGKRIRLEIQKRLENLSKEQMEFILHADSDDAKRMVFYSICKTYQFIYDFVIEVLLPKMQRMDFLISEGEYYSFYNGKLLQHRELETITENSQYKIKQVLFKILEEAKVIDSTKNRMLQPQFLSTELIKLIVKDNSKYLKLFFINEADIKEYDERFN